MINQRSRDLNEILKYVIYNKKRISPSLNVIKEKKIKDSIVLLCSFIINYLSVEFSLCLINLFH